MTLRSFVGPMLAGLLLAGFMGPTYAYDADEVHAILAVRPKAPDARAERVILASQRTVSVKTNGTTSMKDHRLTLIGLAYGALADPATGKPSVKAHFEILQGERKVMASPPATYESDSLSPVVGPVSLASMQPGTYTVRFVVTDTVGKREETRSATFQVLP